MTMWLLESRQLGDVRGFGMMLGRQPGVRVQKLAMFLWPTDGAKRRLSGTIFWAARISARHAGTMETTIDAHVDAVGYVHTCTYVRCVR